MTGSDALTQDQYRILLHLVRNSPTAYGAEEISRRVGLDGRTVVLGLQALAQRRFISSGGATGAGQRGGAAWQATAAGQAYVRDRP
jgi:hypothetical protein